MATEQPAAPSSEPAEIAPETKGAGDSPTAKGEPRPKPSQWSGWKIRTPYSVLVLLKLLPPPPRTIIYTGHNTYQYSTRDERMMSVRDRAWISAWRYVTLRRVLRDLHQGGSNVSRWSLRTCKRRWRSDLRGESPGTLLHGCRFPVAVVHRLLYFRPEVTPVLRHHRVITLHQSTDRLTLLASVHGWPVALRRHIILYFFLHRKFLRVNPPPSPHHSRRCLVHLASVGFPLFLCQSLIFSLLYYTIRYSISYSTSFCAVTVLYTYIPDIDFPENFIFLNILSGCFKNQTGTNGFLPPKIAPLVVF